MRLIFSSVGVDLLEGHWHQNNEFNGDYSVEFKCG